MSEQQATQQNATQPPIQERCLCREIANRYSGPLRTWSCKRFRSLRCIPLAIEKRLQNRR
jgi:hypothetical protein